MSSVYLSERLSHLPQEVLGELDGLVQGEIQTAVTDVLLNPARKFSTFVHASVTLRNTTSCYTISPEFGFNVKL